MLFVKTVLSKAFFPCSLECFMKQHCSKNEISSADLVKFTEEILSGNLLSTVMTSHMPVYDQICSSLFLCSLDSRVNPLMHNVPKLSDTFKNLAIFDWK